MAVFAKTARADFAERMVKHIENDFQPAVQKFGWSRDQLARVVEYGIQRAARHGVDGEKDVELFIDCMVLLGGNFDSDPATAWAGATLQRRDLTGTEKMAIIHDHLLFGSKRADGNA